MSEYYAVQRVGSSLQHYGVKGMKWGVRKAIERGDSKKLEKLYKKAVKKAKRLNTNANLEKMKREYKARMDTAVESGVTAAGVGGMPLALRSAARSQGKRVFGLIGPIPFDSETLPNFTTPIGAAALGISAYNLGKGIAAKRRTSVVGHAKAKVKAEKWRKEMGEAFKKTKYSQLPGAKGENNPYEYNSQRETNTVTLGPTIRADQLPSRRQGSSKKKRKR